MLILNHRIEIDSAELGTIEIDFPTTISIEASWQEFTQKCEIVVGRKLSFEGKEIAFGDGAILKRGQAVRVYGWYDSPDTGDQSDDLIFKGVIADIIPDTPIKILCQDEMWILKQSSVNGTYRNITLNALLQDILPKNADGTLRIPFVNTVNATFGKIRVPNKTVMDVLKYLKKLGIFSYFVDGVLYSGAAYIPEILQNEGSKKITHTIRVQNQVIESDMIYRNAEDIRIKIQAYNINDDNTRFEIEVGDADGEIRRLPFYNRTRADLEEAAQRELERYKINGWVGSFTTFLKPRVKHGDEIKLVDDNVPDRNGTYLVSRVVTTSGINGGRQTITLDRGLNG
jgi:hypothetical protein